MDQQDQQVTVRLLPDGENLPAVLRTIAGPILRIDLQPGTGGTGLDKGGLVEVTCPETLYLGEIRTRQGNTVAIGVEHALDRAALARIQQIWHGPNLPAGGTR